VVNYAQNLGLSFHKPKVLRSLPHSGSQKRQLRIDDPTTEKVNGTTIKIGIPAEQKPGLTGYRELSENI